MSWTPAQTRVEIMPFWGRISLKLEPGRPSKPREKSHSWNPPTQKTLEQLETTLPEALVPAAGSCHTWETTKFSDLLEAQLRHYQHGSRLSKGLKLETLNPCIVSLCFHSFSYWYHLNSSHIYPFHDSVEFHWCQRSLGQILSSFSGTRTLPGMPHASRSQWHGENLIYSFTGTQPVTKDKSRKDHAKLTRREKKTNSQTCFPELCTANPSILCDQTLHGPLPLPWHG